MRACEIIASIAEGIAQILQGRAKAKQAIRSKLQRSQALAVQFDKKFGGNEKPILKWRHRQSMEEAAIVAPRVQTRLPLDDVKDEPPFDAIFAVSLLAAGTAFHGYPRWIEGNPKSLRLTRSAVFTSTSRNCAMICRTCLYVAVTRISKLAFASLYDRPTKLAGARFFGALASLGQRAG